MSFPDESDFGRRPYRGSPSSKRYGKQNVHELSESLRSQDLMGGSGHIHDSPAYSDRIPSKYQRREKNYSPTYVPSQSSDRSVMSISSPQNKKQWPTYDLTTPSVDSGSMDFIPGSPTFSPSSPMNETEFTGPSILAPMQEMPRAPVSYADISGPAPALSSDSSGSLKSWRSPSSRGYSPASPGYSSSSQEYVPKSPGYSPPSPDYSPSTPEFSSSSESEQVGRSVLDPLNENYGVQESELSSMAKMQQAITSDVPVSQRMPQNSYPSWFSPTSDVSARKQRQDTPNPTTLEQKLFAVVEHIAEEYPNIIHIDPAVSAGSNDRYSISLNLTEENLHTFIEQIAEYLPDFIKVHCPTEEESEEQHSEAEESEVEESEESENSALDTRTPIDPHQFDTPSEMYEQDISSPREYSPSYSQDVPESSVPETDEEEESEEEESEEEDSDSEDLPRMRPPPSYSMNDPRFQLPKL